MSFELDQIKHLYDFQSHFLDLNGPRLHYLDEGKGQPVVLLHGNPSWSFMYRELIRSLRPFCRVLVPDHIGCGLSDKPPDYEYSYRLERRVADLSTFLDRLGLHQEISLVVHDWGGPIGFTHAWRHPERVRRLVVLNTAAFLVPAGKKLHWALRFCRKSQLASFLIRRFNAFSWVASRVGCRQKPMSPDLRRAYTGPYDSWENRIATLRFVQDIPLEAGDPSFAVLRETQENLFRLRRKPMLICWGEKDFVFDASFLDEWIRRFPNAEVHRFPRAGHYVLEDAREEIIPLIERFLLQ